MKKVVMVLALIVAVGLPTVTFAYGEGPSSSSNWVEGTVSYGSGSTCGKCRISLETKNGFSKTGFTDSSGNYKIYIASKYVIAVYVGGKKVWSGSRNAKGGAQINVLVR